MTIDLAAAKLHHASQTLAEAKQTHAAMVALVAREQAGFDRLHATGAAVRAALSAQEWASSMLVTAIAATPDADLRRRLEAAHA